MSSPVVLAFEATDGAERMHDRRYDLPRRELLTLEDAMVVRPPNGRAKVEQAHTSSARGRSAGSSRPKRWLDSSRLAGGRMAGSDGP